MIVNLTHFFYMLAVWSLSGFLFGTLVCAAVVIRFYLTNDPSNYDRCFLYMGKVSHTRLKGGATHHFVYPLFFSFIDLEQIQEVGWSFWPIFKLNGGRYTFCSLDEKDHLQDWKKERKDNDTDAIDENLLQSVHSFIKNRTKGTKVLSPGYTTHLMAHLTYFGYCFNPISIFYCLRPQKKSGDLSIANELKDTKNMIPKDSVSTAVKNILTTDASATKTSTNTDADKEKEREKESSIESVIVEVSNTPWIEQHSYMLDETVENVSVTRNVEMKGQKGSFQAVWLKNFHVSPFMEMDYKYHFTFSEPKETVWVQSQMTKLSTNEVWFTVNFELNRIPFTPLNLLYVLLFYPFYTRVIQVLIHYEAVKLFLKGVPTFNHPKGTPVEFGFGITDKKLIKFIAYLNKKYAAIFGSKKDFVKEKKNE